jgi:hypothetical protein
MKTMSIVVCLLFATCAGFRAEDVDPIDTLVKKLDASRGIWLNGGAPAINLPSNATPKEVIAEAVRKQPFDEGLIKSYTNEAIREIELSNLVGQKEKYSAVLLQTDLGTKNLVFNFKTFGHWWIRFYPVTDNKPSG